MTSLSLLRRWKNDMFYDNIKPDIVISVVFTQNDDVVVAYWNIEYNQEVVCPYPKYFGRKLFSKTL